MFILFLSAPTPAPRHNPSSLPTKTPTELMPSTSPTETCNDSSNVNGLGIDCESYLDMFTVDASVICVISIDYAEQCCTLCKSHLIVTHGPSQGTKWVWDKWVKN